MVEASCFEAVLGLFMNTSKKHSVWAQNLPALARAQKNINKSLPEHQKWLLRIAHLSTRASQHLVVGRDGDFTVKVHQLLQAGVVLSLTHNGARAVLLGIDHEMSEATLGTEAGAEEKECETLCDCTPKKRF